MPVRCAIACCVFIAATNVYSQDKPRLPQDVPPVIAMATAQELSGGREGGYQIKLVLPSIRYDIVAREYRAGKVAHWQDVMTRVKPVTRTLKFETASQIPDSQVVGMDGKPMDPETILSRLKDETPVLVSVSGKMVDPYYLQLAKDDSVIILLSRKDGKGDEQLLPKFEQDRSTRPSR